MDNITTYREAVREAISKAKDKDWPVIAALGYAVVGRSAAQAA